MITTERTRRSRKVFAWISIGVLALLLSVSLFLNLILSTVIVGRKSFAGDAPRLKETVIEGKGMNKAVLIPIHGIIAQTGGSYSWPGRASTSFISAQIKAAMKDRSVKAVLLEFNSPGGGVGDSDLLYHQVRELRGTGKPVISVLRDIATSGAYYIAVASDSIVAQPTTITGSIGVILQSVNIEGLFQKIGIRDVTIKKGRMKDMMSPMRTLSPEEEAVLQGITDDVYDRFVGIVAENRNMELEDVRSLADGRIFLAGEAHALGLIDEIGYREDALEKAREALGVDELRLVQYEKSFSFRDLIGASSWALPPSLGAWNGLLGAGSPRLMYLWTLN